MKKRLILYAGIVVLAAAAGWSVLWHVAAGRVHQALDSAMIREKELGREWKCRELNRSGFPFALNFRCRELTVKSARANQVFDGSIPSGHVRYSIFSPNGACVKTRFRHLGQADSVH